VTLRSVISYSGFKNDSLISAKGKMKEYITLSVAEAELMAFIACVQEMIHVKHLIKLMNLNVDLLMIIKVDNKGGKDLVNNWSICGRTRLFGVRLNYLHKLKEDGMILVKSIRSEEKCNRHSDKKIYRPLFTKLGKSPDLDIAIIKKTMLQGRVLKIKVRRRRKSDSVIPATYSIL
jgi:hypothetical protein